jgi:hypothetical protein
MLCFVTFINFCSSRSNPLICVCLSWSVSICVRPYAPHNRRRRLIPRPVKKLTTEIFRDILRTSRELCFLWKLPASRPMGRYNRSPPGSPCARMPECPSAECQCA